MAGMSMSSIDSFVQGGSGIFRFIDSLSKMNKSQEDIDKLMANYPKVEMQQGYKNALQTVNTLAGGKAPWYYTAMGNIDAATGQSIGAAEKGAMSSAQLQETLGKLNQQSLQEKGAMDVEQGKFYADAQKLKADTQWKYGDEQKSVWDQNIWQQFKKKLQMAEYAKGQSYESMNAGLDTFLASSEKFGGSMGGGDFSSMFG